MTADFDWLEAYGVRRSDVARDTALGRVVSAHRGEWDLVTDSGPVRAIHCFDRTAPVVGDWVRWETVPGGQAAVQQVLPRRGVLRRKAAGRGDRAQLVAVHVDVAFLLLPLTLDPNPRVVERYLALSHDGGVEPLIVLTKLDLVDAEVATRRAACILPPEQPRVLVSASTGFGLAELDSYFEDRSTVALLGPSGAGKSTLLNALVDTARQLTQDVLENGKGRHTTTRRELFARPRGGVVIDTPGMRELGLFDADEGVASAFPEILALIGSCRFRNCRHGSEPGCALRAAVASGVVESPRLDSFLALQAGAGVVSTRFPRLRRR